MPTSGLVYHAIVQITSDRYGYLGHICLSPLIAACIYQILSTDESQCTDNNRLSDRMQKKSRKRIIFSGVFISTALLCITNGVNTYNQLPIWKDDLALWDYSLKVDPDDWRVLDRKVEYLRMQ